MDNRVVRIQSTPLARPADATAYAAGDEIANSATAGLVVRQTFEITGWRRVVLKRLGCDVTPASGNLVIVAFDFAALVFKTADVPAAVGDNVVLNITAVQRDKAAKFSFVNTAWTAPNGGVAAGTDGFQEVLPAVPTVNGHVFMINPADGVPGVQPVSARTLSIVLQVQGAWTPGAVVNNFTFWGDFEVEA